METKAFPTADVLSTITGRLMGEMGGVYEVCNWMTGENVFTHQLPRICREAVPVVISFRPDLAKAVEEAQQVNPENYRDWLVTWITRYGETINVPRFTAEEHERIDPLSELIEMVPPEKIVIVKGG